MRVVPAVPSSNGRLLEEVCAEGEACFPCSFADSICVTTTARAGAATRSEALKRNATFAGR